MLGICAVLCSGMTAIAANVPPSFTGGRHQLLMVCENSTATSINALMAVADADAGQTETWNVRTGAGHGTLVAAYTTTSTGSTMTPTGLTYMPNTGFAGSDTFTVTVGDGTDVDTTIVVVTVNPLPVVGAITYGRFAGVCPGDTIIFGDTSTTGTWSSSNTNATVGATGIVTGLHTGLDTIMYSVTNACGTSTVTQTLVVKVIPHAGPIAGPTALCAAKTVTLSDGTGGGTWGTTAPGVARVSTGGVVAGVTAGTATIFYVIKNDCGSDTALHNVTVDLPALPILDSTDKVCPFNVLVLVELTTGGTWSSSSLMTAAVLGGVVLGIAPGVATITYTVNNGCGKTTATVDITVLGTDECGGGPLSVAPGSAGKEGISLFPNPNSGKFTINCTSKENEEVKIVVTNMLGQQVRVLSTTTNKANDILLDVPAGVYCVTAVTGGRRYTEHVTVVR